MNIQDVVDIHAICQHGSFRKAATALGISQPTLSTRVHRLEEKLGVQLFYAQRGKSTPTRLAHFIAERSSQLLQDADDLAQRATRLARGQEGHLKIGFGPAAMHILFPEIIRELQLADLDIALDCDFGATQDMVIALTEGDLDLVIGPFDSAMEDPRIDVEPLFEDEYVGVLHVNHPLAGGPVTDPEVPYQYPLALTDLEPRIERIGREEYVPIEEIKNLVTCSDYSVLIDLVQDATHITAGPRYVFLDHVRAGNLVTYTPPLGKISHTECCIRNSEALPIPAIDQVIEISRGISKVIKGELLRNPDLGMLDARG
ncbi:MAG: LysR family transcriptional regulator [Xanthomonadales bacterium]|nr:LysR family transcriptional regulator [Xanthomonadales bacterium]